MQLKTMRQCAQYYASLGLALVPIHSGEKTPYLKNWADQATAEKSQIDKWWKTWPDANIGFVTGQKSSGIYAIDLDVDEHKGEDGRETLNQWEIKNDTQLPDTWRDISGRGGTHLYFHSASLIENDLRDTYPDIEIRGEGLLVILPPSLHKSGNRYQWETGFAPWEIGIAETNDIVKQFIGYGKKKEKSNVFHIPDVIPEGNRNNTLFRLACSMQARGDSETAIRAAVKAENEARCVPPLDDRDIEKIIISALKYDNDTAPYNITVKEGIITPKEKELIKPQIVLASNTAEKDAEWLIPEYIPKNQISILAGSGGVGKTTIWCSLAAGISSGSRTFFERDIPDDWSKRTPGRVLFFSAEDSAEYVIIRRLRKNGANLDNIGYIDIKDERFSDIAFNSLALEKLIAEFNPVLTIFDPIQSFVPANIKMGDRNAMRQCLSPLIGWGEKYGVTSLIIVHANKMANVWGKKRIADSADIWDIARSVLMVGETSEAGINYISHEKSNYGVCGQSILYSLDDETLTFKGYSNKKDRDFVSETEYAKVSPVRDEAKDFIVDLLKDGEIEARKVDEAARARGISKSTMTRAKQDLKSQGVIKYFTKGCGYGKGTVYYMSLC